MSSSILPLKIFNHRPVFRSISGWENLREFAELPGCAAPSLAYLGGVYFWDHKIEGNKRILIGEDFESFINSLAPDGTYLSALRVAKIRSSPE